MFIGSRIYPKLPLGRLFSMIYIKLVFIEVQKWRLRLFHSLWSKQNVLFDVSIICTRSYECKIKSFSNREIYDSWNLFRIFLDPL
jgi:hypothetical protein